MLYYIWLWIIHTALLASFLLHACLVSHLFQLPSTLRWLCTTTVFHCALQPVVSVGLSYLFGTQAAVVSSRLYELSMNIESYLDRNIPVKYMYQYSMTSDVYTYMLDVLYTKSNELLTGTRSNTTSDMICSTFNIKSWLSTAPVTTGPRSHVIWWRPLVDMSYLLACCHAVFHMCCILELATVAIKGVVTALTTKAPGIKKNKQS